MSIYFNSHHATWMLFSVSYTIYLYCKSSLVSKILARKELYIYIYLQKYSGNKAYILNYRSVVESWRLAQLMTDRNTYR
jgi:hypothetical protein